MIVVTVIDITQINLAGFLPAQFFAEHLALLALPFDRGTHFWRDQKLNSAHNQVGRLACSVAAVGPGLS